MRKKFSWTNTLELGAENVPQQTKSKVEEHNVASEFRSDAQFPRKSLYEHQYTSLFFVTTSNHYIEFQKRFSAKADFSGFNGPVFRNQHSLKFLKPLSPNLPVVCSQFCVSGTQCADSRPRSFLQANHCGVASVCRI